MVERKDNGICNCDYAKLAIEKLQREMLYPTLKCENPNCEVRFVRSGSQIPTCEKIKRHGVPRCAWVVAEISHLKGRLEASERKAIEHNVPNSTLERLREEIFKLSSEANEMGYWEIVSSY